MPSCTAKMKVVTRLNLSTMAPATTTVSSEEKITGSSTMGSATKRR